MQVLLALSILGIATTPKLDPALRAEVESRIPVIEAWAADPQVVAAVREANEALRSQEEIHDLDETWMATFGVDDFMKSIIDHPAADRLRELREDHPELQEAILTDRLGANVATTNKTSDFYQGDEAKFREAFAGGAGGTHVGELAKDESIQSYAVPVGVPVLDDGEAIGVLIVTVNVQKLDPSRR